MKALTRQALTADRAHVVELLADIPDTDPVGRLAFESRLAEINATLQEFEEHGNPIGQVALMFAGAPVRGSHSIGVDFAGTMIGLFQDLVTKQLATGERGQLGARGPLPLRAPSTLAITDIVRGSVGFVLEETGPNGEIADTAVKKAIDDVTGVIAASAGESVVDFERAVETLDGRLLSSLKSFFATLDDASATMRIVEEDRDESLNAAAVRRARERIDHTDFEDRDTEELVGELIGLLPGPRRFEIRLRGTNERITGYVGATVGPRYLELIEDPDERIVGQHWRMRMRIREIRERNKPPRTLYTLLGLLERVDPV